MRRIENVGPATVQATASGQYTAKSASRAREHDLRCLAACLMHHTSIMRIIVSEYRACRPTVGLCTLSPTPTKYKQSHTRLDKT